MGKNIDLTQPLSDEDRAWLEERGKINDIRVADEIAGVSTDPEPVSAQTDDGTDDEDDDSTADSEEYGDWTKAQMQYELGERGLPQSGNKAELAARLEEDDAAKAASA
jgi:hypothetical protein